MTKNNDVAVLRQDNTALMKKPGELVTVAPLADIYETPDAFVLMLDMPGAMKDSINITLDESSLVIRADVDLYRKDASVMFREIPGVGFHRAFNVTAAIDHNKVDARYENGVLTVTLLKKEEMKPREIRIQ